MDPITGTPSIREVYQLIQELRLDIDRKLTEHERDHAAENERRSAFIRWAITTAIAILAVAIAALR